jgi:hypothetical protein
VFTAEGNKLRVVSTFRLALRGVSSFTMVEYAKPAERERLECFNLIA